MKTQRTMVALALAAAFSAACAGETTAPLPQAAAPSGSVAAVISVTPASPYSGRLASFSSAALTGAGERTWDFGDGHGDTGVDVGHVFVAAGTYSVTLTLSDGRRAFTVVQVSDVQKPDPLSSRR
jgi:PKD repeat protein